MPLQAATVKQKWIFRLQHTLLSFRGFYTRQAARSLFGKRSLVENYDLLKQLQRPMHILTNRQVRKIDKAVICDAEDTVSMILNLSVPAIALKGKEDYVPVPPKIETKVVEGGHISPLEEADAVLDLIRKLAGTNN